MSLALHVVISEHPQEKGGAAQRGVRPSVCCYSCFSTSSWESYGLSLELGAYVVIGLG